MPVTRGVLCPADVYRPPASSPYTALAPEVIAETYWNLHTQPADDWIDEIHFKGQ